MAREATGAQANNRDNFKNASEINDALTLLMGRRLAFLDLALVVTVLLMVVSGAVVVLFHVVFLLLTLGAFYWTFRAFAVRAGFWVTITALVVLAAILNGETPAEELSEIPMLTGVLLVVFFIARQRSRAEDALRKSNEELESRVAKRTDELTRVNSELSREVSQHQQTVEILRESEERYRQLVERSFEAIIIHSGEELIHINPAGARLLGADSPEELVGKSMRSFIHPDQWDRVLTWVQMTGEKRRGVPLLEEKLIRLDGTCVDVESASIPITYLGRPAAQTVIHDISARLRAERERERERARIARDLHDSLGHSLGYLHLKLDGFASDEVQQSIPAVRRELAQMRDVANEAYEMVRGMLAALHSSGSDDLPTAMLIQARAIGKRGGFEVQVTTDGRPQPVDPIVQQQTLYLFQEALINVERHANAQQVHIRMSWAEDHLTITMTDDGCGFSVDDMQISGHYGRRIMQERVDEIDGHLTLNSRPGAGTEVMLQLPLTSDKELVTKKW